MPEDHYVVRVSVNGVPFPEGRICNGAHKHYHCSFYVSLQWTQHRCLNLQLEVWNGFSHLFPTLTVTLLSLSGIARLLSTLWLQSVAPQVPLFTSKACSYVAVQFELDIKPTSKSPQAPCSQFEDGCTLMCTEATLKRAPMASTSDF